MKRQLLYSHITIFSAVLLTVCSLLPASGQPLRQAEPGIKVLGASHDNKGNTSPTSGSSRTGQVKNYRSRRAPSAVVSTLTPQKLKDARKLTADALRFYNEGLAADKKGDLNGAVIKLKQSLAIREYYWHERDTNIPIILEKLADVYAKQNKLSESADTLERSLTYYTRIFGPGTIERIPSLMAIGTVLQKKGDHAKSFDFFKQAYTLVERSKGKNSPEAMKLRLILARSAKANEWYPTASEFYQECISLDSAQLPPSEHALALEEYSAVLTKMGKEAEAKAILAKAHPAEH